MIVRIISIHPSDAYFPDRDEIIGLEGKAHGFVMEGVGWYSFDFVPNHLRTPIYFSCAGFERL